YRVHAEAAGSAIGGQHDLAVLTGAHEAETALPLVELAKARTQVALNTPVLQKVPVFCRHHRVGAPHNKLVLHLTPRTHDNRLPRNGRPQPRSPVGTVAASPTAPRCPGAPQGSVASDRRFPWTAHTSKNNNGLTSPRAAPRGPGPGFRPGSLSALPGTPCPRRGAAAPAAQSAPPYPGKCCRSSVGPGPTQNRSTA